MSSPTTTDARRRRLNELTHRAASGDRTALNDLLTQLTPMVRGYARRYARRFRLDADDLIQVGLITLAHSMPRFRSDRGAGPLHFAILCASRRMAREVRQEVRRREV